MIDVLLPLFLLAILTYTLRHLARNPSFLPSHRLTHTRPTSSPGWSWEYIHPTLSLFTTSFNTLPRFLLTRLRPRGTAALAKVYDLGAMVGVIGGVAGIGGLFWAWAEVWLAVWEESRLHASWRGDKVEEAVAIVRRAMVGEVGSVTRGEALQPLIPGVTMPFSHLPTLVLALALNQLFHEFGHALSAAIDDISPSRLSLNLHLLLPSMIVNFPSNVDTLAPWSKMRLASAGSFHNLLTYLMLGSLALSGFGRLFWYDASAHGRVIQAVDRRSPLYDHLEPGILISHVDDQFLGGTEDVWEKYLSSDDIGDIGQGWCVDRLSFLVSDSQLILILQDLPAAPCIDPQDISFTQAMSTSAQPPITRCLSPHPILDIPSTPCGCPAKWMCIRPSAEEGILRIQLAQKGVLLWAGDRRGILEGVKLGTDGTRFGFLGGVIRWGAMFLQYMSNVALSLSLFNLIPFPRTDGSILLTSLLHLHRVKTPTTPPLPLRTTLSTTGRSTPPNPRINLNAYKEYELNSGDEDGDEEDGRGGGVGGRKKEVGWRRRVKRIVEFGCMGLGVGWALGWGMLGLLRSS